tara:strand:+ start:424 stop:624 length:201 start_codon:yes stop_codon:yes gene_type:complete
MKLWLTILVDTSDPLLDMSGSALHCWREDGRTLCEPDFDVSYNGISVENMDYDAAQAYLEERRNDH